MLYTLHYPENSFLPYFCFLHDFNNELDKLMDKCLYLTCKEHLCYSSPEK